MSKEETQEALEKANKIIDEWKENLIESREAMELIAPLVESITTYFEKIQDEIDKLNYKKRTTIEEKGINNQEENEAGTEGEK